MTKNVAVWFALVCSGACVSQDPAESITVSPAIGPATITVDKTFYQYADPIVISFAGLNGNPQDFVTIAPMGSPFSTTTRWGYTNGMASGTKQLEGPTPGGMYVARAFDNNTFTLMGESDPFQVADVSDTNATIATDQPNYAIDQTIVVSFTGLPPNAIDWVAVKPVGSSDHTEALWGYTSGVANGSVTFPQGLARVSATHTGGMYYARVYLNGTYTFVAETAPFLIGSLVTTDMATYNPYQPITVSWQHLPGNPGDYVALAPAGSAVSTISKWLFSGGTVNGSRTFAPGLPNVGMYVARTFSPNTYIMSGQSVPFEVVAGPEITLNTNLPTYTPGQAITVSWTNMPGNANDWIGLAPAGSPDTTVLKWVYTAGQVNGMTTFGSGLGTPGNYETRAFLNNSYIRLATTPFTVN